MLRSRVHCYMVCILYYICTYVAHQRSQRPLLHSVANVLILSLTESHVLGGVAILSPSIEMKKMWTAAIVLSARCDIM